jgi:hypothetical protein
MSEAPDGADGWTASEGTGDPLASIPVPGSEVSGTVPTDGDLPVDGLGGADPIGSPPRRRKRSIAIVTSAVAVVALVAGVLVATIGSTPNADAAVITAINSAMGQKTAHVSVTGTVAVAGQTEQLTGTGGFDFAANAEQMNLNVQTVGQTVGVQVVSLGGTIYEQIPGLSQLASGKDWVSIDVSSLQQNADRSAASQLGGNPIATLHALAQQGNSVTALGPSVVDGTSVQGYSVTMDPAVVKRELSQADLPAWMKKAASTVTIGNASQTVYLDDAGNLVRLGSTINESAGSAGSIKVQESMDFSDYGAPVSVSSPPADEVIPFNQYLQLANQSQAT